MRLRQVAGIPLVATIALSGALAFGGCGSDSNAATGESTTDSMHHQAMHHEGESMKHEGHSMKHEDKSMHHEGSSDNQMEG
jgi:hypothetical protein